jgi:hypothetical protein
MYIEMMNTLDADLEADMSAWREQFLTPRYSWGEQKESVVRNTAPKCSASTDPANIGQPSTTSTSAISNGEQCAKRTSGIKHQHESDDGPDLKSLQKQLQERKDAGNVVVAILDMLGDTLRAEQGKSLLTAQQCAEALRTAQELVQTLTIRSSEDSSWMNPDVTKMKENTLFVSCGQYKTLPGKASEVARIMESTQGKYYRAQPGCLHYIHGVALDREDLAMSISVWTSRDAFFSLPKDPSDLEKLNKARSPAYELMQGGSLKTAGSHFMAYKSFGPPVEAPPLSAKFPNFDEVFNERGPSVDAVEKKELYVLQSRIRVQPGKLEEACRGLEATNSNYYRGKNGCIFYAFGVGDPDHYAKDSVIGTCIFDRKELFDALPSTPEETSKLVEARAPFYAMMDGSVEEATTAFFHMNETYQAL